MNPELLVSLIQTGGVVTVLGLNFYFFLTGKLISRSMHDEILKVYENEMAKITNGLMGSMKTLQEGQQEMHKSNLEYRTKIDSVIVNLVGTMNSIDTHLKERTK